MNYAHAQRIRVCCHNTDLVHVNGHDRTILVIFSHGSLMMDPLWSETCWSTFKYFIILIVSTYYILCIGWMINCLILSTYYKPWFKTMDSISYVYISWTVQDIWLTYIPFERKMLIFQISPPECSPSAKPCSSVSWEQNGYYAAQDLFAFVSSLKLSQRLLCSVRFVFVSIFNRIQPQPTV